MLVTKVTLLKKAPASNVTKPPYLAKRTPITLCDTPLPPETDFSNLSMLLHGDRKVGKTALLSQFPDNYFIMWEDGAKFQRVRQTRCRCWEDFQDLVALLEAKGKGYARTYTTDTGHGQYQAALNYIMRTQHLDDIRDDDWGTGWTMVDREFTELNARLLALGGYFVTAHTDTAEITRRDGSKYTKHSLQLGKQARRWFSGFVDVIGYFTYNVSGQRVLQLNGNLEFEAGTRTPENFFYTNGKPVEVIPMGGNAREAFTNFVKAFENKLPEPASVLKPKALPVARKA